MSKTARIPERPDALPTGSLALDARLGGGWPRGRVAEVYGRPGSGKTTLVLEALAAGLAALIDADHATDARSAGRFGLDLERMPYLRTNALEDAFEVVEELARGGAAALIALDGIGALLPKGAGRCADVPPTKNEEHRHQVEHCLRALLGPLSRSGAALLITNRLTEKPGVFFGSPDATPWETASLADFASVRVETSRVGAVKEGDEAVGFEMQTKVTKSRLAAPQASARFEVLFASGIDREGELLTLAQGQGAVLKRGGGLFFRDESLGRGRNEAVARLRRDGPLAGRLRDAQREAASA